MSKFDWTPDLVMDKIDDFLDPLLEAAGLDLDYEIIEGGLDSDLITPEITVDFSGDDVDLLLAQRAELLLALEQLTLEALRIPHEERYKLVFDAQDYRVMRIEELRMSAEQAAAKVRKTGRPFHFQPMTSRERRILHVALSEYPGVRTTSEDVPPRRHTVVYPAD